MSEEVSKDLYNPAPVKKAWKSKTLWVNVIMAIVPFLPGPVGDFLTVENIGLLFMVVNTILRFVTKEQISIT